MEARTSSFLDVPDGTDSHACFYRAIVANLADAVTIVDDSGLVLFSSPSIGDVIEQSPAGPTGRSVFELVHPDDLNQVRSAFEEVMRRTGEQSAPIEFRCRTRSGEWQTLESVGRRCMTADGRVLVLVQSRNTSERRAREDRRAQAESLEAVATVSRAIAGDFNDLLSVLIRRVGLLESATSPAVRDEARSMRTAIDRARVLFDQLLVFSNVEGAGAGESSDVNQAMETLSGSIEQMSGPNIEITYLLGAASSRVAVASGSLEQLLIALVVYARGAMPYGGRLTIVTRNTSVAPSTDTPSVRRIGESLVIEITFSGINVVADARRRILKPEVSAEGMELGLHTVFGIAQRAGGHVAIDSDVSAGTTIRVLLPVRRGV